MRRSTVSAAEFKAQEYHHVFATTAHPSPVATPMPMPVAAWSASCKRPHVLGCARPATPTPPPARTNGLHLSLDVPGIARDQLSIAIEGHGGYASAARKAPRRYQAAYEFPLEIDTATSEAKLENGVLTLKLVKKLPSATSPN